MDRASKNICYPLVFPVLYHAAAVPPFSPSIKESVISKIYFIPILGSNNRIRVALDNPITIQSYCSIFVWFFNVMKYSGMFVPFVYMDNQIIDRILINIHLKMILFITSVNKISKQQIDHLDLMEIHLFI